MRKICFKHSNRCFSASTRFYSTIVGAAPGTEKNTNISNNVAQIKAVVASLDGRASLFATTGNNKSSNKPASASASHHPISITEQFFKGRNNQLVQPNANNNDDTNKLQARQQQDRLAVEASHRGTESDQSQAVGHHVCVNECTLMGHVDASTITRGTGAVAYDHSREVVQLMLQTKGDDAGAETVPIRIPSNEISDVFFSCGISGFDELKKRIGNKNNKEVGVLVTVRGTLKNVVEIDEVTKVPFLVPFVLVRASSGIVHVMD